MSDAIDVETIEDPFALIVGARSGLDGVRVFLTDAGDNRGGWRDVMRDEHMRGLLLGQLAFIGLHLAQLTKILTAIPTQRELLAVDVMAAAFELEAAREEISRRTSGPPR